jgi:tripartite-type tricarboxylate transporter receptor subunit TctC
MPARWTFLARLTILIGSFAYALPTFGQTYPARPVKIITGDAANFVDIVARRISTSLSERWGQAVIVENRPGAGLTIATAAAARSPADGYTILLNDRTALSVAPSLWKNLSYEPAKDLAPLTLIATTPLILVGHQSVPAGNLAEFVQHLRKQSATDFFTSGPSTGNHLANELLKQSAGINIVNVHYKGSPPAVSGLLAGETRGGFMLVPVILPHIKSGRVKAYAITSGKRFAGTPEIPSVTELGMPELESEYWIAMMAPVGTPQPIIDKLNRDLVDIMKTPAMREFLLAQGAEPAYGTPADLSALIRTETAKWKKVIDAAGIRLE